MSKMKFIKYKGNVYTRCELCNKKFCIGTENEFKENIKKYNVNIDIAKWFCCEEHEELYCKSS